MPDPWDDPRAQELIRDVEANMVPKLRESQLVATIYSGDVDVKLAVETGAAVLLDKPIVGVVAPGVRIPEKLARVVDRFLEADLSEPGASQDLADRVAAVVAEFAREGRLG